MQVRVTIAQKARSSFGFELKSPSQGVAREGSAAEHRQWSTRTQRRVQVKHETTNSAREPHPHLGLRLADPPVGAAAHVLLRDQLEIAARVGVHQTPVAIAHDVVLRVHMRISKDRNVLLPAAHGITPQADVGYTGV